MSDMKKLSFAEINAAHEARRHNSDLQNLASALEYVRESQKVAAKLEKEILEAAAAVESGEGIHVTVLKELYERARGFK